MNGIDVCHFCRSDFTRSVWATPNLSHVDCAECGASGPLRPTEEAAIASWNELSAYAKPGLVPDHPTYISLIGKQGEPAGEFSVYVSYSDGQRLELFTTGANLISQSAKLPMKPPLKVKP